MRKFWYRGAHWVRSDESGGHVSYKGTFSNTDRSGTTNFMIANGLATKFSEKGVTPEYRKPEENTDAIVITLSTRNGDDIDKFLEMERNRRKKGDKKQDKEKKKAKPVSVPEQAAPIAAAEVLKIFPAEADGDDDDVFVADKKPAAKKYRKPSASEAKTLIAKQCWESHHTHHGNEIVSRSADFTDPETAFQIAYYLKQSKRISKRDYEFILGDIKDLESGDRVAVSIAISENVYQELMNPFAKKSSKKPEQSEKLFEL